MANSHFVPNLFRNRRQLNELTATAWSKRREAGLQYSQSKTTIDRSVGADATEPARTLSPYAFYSDPRGFGLEASYTNLDEKTQISGTPDDTGKTGRLSFRSGYAIPNTRHGLSFSYDGSEFEETDGATDRTTAERSDVVSFGYGAKLENQIYLGGGVKEAHIDGPSQTQWLVGGGMLFGPEDNPDGAFEAVLSFVNYQSRQNINLLFDLVVNEGPLQYYGLLDVYKAQGSFETLNIKLTGGMDYQTSPVYFGPELEYLIVNQDGANTQDSRMLKASIEVGFRVPQFEVFGRYSMSDDAIELTNGTERDEHNELWTLGAAYFY